MSEIKDGKSSAPPPPQPLKEGDDYEIDPKTGLMILSRAYLERRGTCCGSGCVNCPFGVVVRDPDEPVGTRK